jgi:hypothetical protein
VVPESPTAQDSPVEEQQQPKDQDIEDNSNEEYPPPTDAGDEKMYRDADEVESFGSKLQFPPAGFGSRVLCRHKGPAFRTSRSDAVADAAW